jgi:3-isopropylmalate/(R)-2-methylmalate dehydratase small subunit
MTQGLLPEGTTWKLGDDINTDIITPGRYSHLRSHLEELAKHALEDAELEGTSKRFVEVVSENDYVVGGRNFGLGSSREAAPLVIKMAGVSAILAKSFARIFFRNAINIGLPVIECDTDQIEPGDRIKVDLAEGLVLNVTQGKKIPFNPLPEIMVKILNAGGLVSYVQEHNGYELA